MVYDTPIFRILALYLDFEGAKNINVLYVLILGFGGCWIFLIGVRHFHLGLDMVMVFDIPLIQILALYLDFECAKDIHVLYILI